MRAVQPGAARRVVMYSSLIWGAVYGGANELPGSGVEGSSGRHIRLRRLVGELPMAPADQWVFPICQR
jgi:hypothetical protein